MWNSLFWILVEWCYIAGSVLITVKLLELFARMERNINKRRAAKKNLKKAK